jgi:hypothetical protein
MKRREVHRGADAAPSVARGWGAEAPEAYRPFSEQRLARPWPPHVRQRGERYDGAV